MDNAPRAPTDGREVAALVNHLFATRLAPNGRPWTMAQVSTGTGGKVSLAYLSLLRKGGIAAPSLEKLQALADFFGVDVRYFATAELPSETGAPALDEELQRALTQPLIRELARRASGLSEDEQALVLQMIENANRLAAQILQREREQGQKAGPPDTPWDAEAARPGEQ